MKLNKYLELTINQDKSTCERLIKNKQVRVNETIVSNPKYIVKELKDQVYLDNELLVYEEYIYLMMNKRSGYISSTNDNFQQTVFEDIKEFNNRELRLVGRLDKDTEGLLLITDDGALIHHLTSPKHNITKTYFIKYSGVPIPNIEEQFQKGLVLEDGEKCLPATFEKRGQTEALIKIQEGKFHQVKRMCLACGIKVEYLKRLAIGNIYLDDKLKTGEYRKLTTSEIEELKK